MSDLQPKPFKRLEPRRGWTGLIGMLRDLLQARELVQFFAWREIRLRYQETGVGVLWAVVQPVASVIVLTVAFARLGTQLEGVPFASFVLAALVPWQFFSRAMTEGSNTLIANRQMVTKTYFARLTIPVASVLVGLMELGIGIVALAILVGAQGVRPSIKLLAVPVLILILVLASSGASILLAALNARFRDARHIIPFVTQLLLFATPIVYSAAQVPESVRVVYGFYPLVGVIEGLRWTFFGGQAPWVTILQSSVGAVFLCLAGLSYFRRAEQILPDLL
jgi:lipopolysaccharide transport system permease protein